MAAQKSMDPPDHQMSEAVGEQEAWWRDGGQGGGEAIALVSRQNLAAVEQMNAAAKNLASESDSLRTRSSSSPSRRPDGAERNPRPSRSGSPRWTRCPTTRPASRPSSARWRTSRRRCASAPIRLAARYVEPGELGAWRRTGGRGPPRRGARRTGVPGALRPAAPPQAMLSLADEDVVEVRAPDPGPDRRPAAAPRCCR